MYRPFSSLFSLCVVKIDIMKEQLQKRALLLSYLTVGYNVIEGAVSIFAGYLAGSIALVGFGLDSFVESLPAAS